MRKRKHYNVVAAVVEVDGKVLCMQRGVTRYSYTSHLWEFPGGKIEDGETPEQALHRELIEEMDFDVEVHEHMATVFKRTTVLKTVFNIGKRFIINSQLSISMCQGHDG